MNHQSNTLSPRLCSLALLAACALAVTGCGSGALHNGVSDIHDIAIPSLQGKAFGGQQAIGGGVVQLWTVGLPSTGGSYGSGQTSLISSTVTTSTDGSGSFDITGDYSCPSNSYVYITITGGNSGGGTNSAIRLMTALGACANLTDTMFINVNEATTIAGVFALQQFASATFGTAGSFSIGAPSTNITGLQNAFAAANNLVNFQSGAIPVSTTNTATVNSVAVSVVTTSENMKIAQLANILAYCVNSADQSGGALSTNCSTLFNAVQPASQVSPAVDTLQAALDLAINPTNVGSTTSAPFNLVSAQPPFSPNLGSTPPNDWTLGLSYSSPTSFTTPAYKFMSNGYGVAISSTGNIYVINSPGSTTGNSVAVLGPDGMPVTSILNGSTLGSPRGIALDTNDNVWVAANASTTNALVEYAGGSTYNYNSTGSTVLYGIAVDASNNIFVTSSASGELEELVGGAGAGTVTNVAGIGTGAEQLAIDTNYNIWIANSTSGTVTKAGATCTSTPCTYAIGNKVSYTSLASDFGIALDQNQVPWVTNSAAGEITRLDPATPIAGGTSSAASLGGLTNPLFVAMDGSSNLWVTNNNTTSNSVSEIASGSTTMALSPGTGFKHTFATPRAIAIDGSGNVWVANSNGSTSTTAPVLTEIVGAATPAVQPLSRAILLNKIGKAP
ncbi:MAG TPA: hypothetical protein VGB94_06560 [Acidobacteriaceae bacterium]